MKAFLSIIAALLIVIGIVAGLVLFGPFKSLLPQGASDVISDQFPDYFGGQRPSPGTQPGTTPGQTQPRTEPTWKFPSATGEDIQVLKFASSTADTPPATDAVVAGSGSAASEFIIEYVARDKSFNIALFKEPLSEARKHAEEEFMSVLGVTQGEACRLLYVVQVPSSVNTFYSGKNLGFGFCPGATQL